MTPFDLGKQAARKQAVFPALWGAAKAVLPYAAMMFGPALFEKLTGGGAPAQTPGGAAAPAPGGASNDIGHAALAQARAKYDPNAQFGGLSPRMGNWMKGQQMQRGMNKHFFRQLHAPKW